MSVSSGDSRNLESPGRLRRHRKCILLGISRKKRRLRRLQNLLPQKLEDFADFAEIPSTSFETITLVPI